MLKKTLFIGLVGSITSSFAMQNFTIGTGGVNGTYYPTGKNICEFYNTTKKQDDIICKVIPTDGSIYNINSLTNKNLQFGIAQSDVIHQAISGQGKFQGKKQPNLRSIMAIYPELLSLVVRKDSNITTLDKIKGKRVNLGNPGGGNETTTKVIFDAFGIKNSDPLLWSSQSTQEAPKLLAENKIDGYFYMVGHPAKNISNTQKLTPIDLVPIEGKNAQNLIKKYPYYATGYIPANTYEGINKDVQSIGVKAVLVTTKNMDDKTVQSMLKAVFDNFEEFKQKNPAYKSITKESLLEGLTAPLHKSAKKYYEDLGLLK